MLRAHCSVYLRSMQILKQTKKTIQKIECSYMIQNIFLRNWTEGLQMIISSLLAMTFVLFLTYWKSLLRVMSGYHRHTSMYVAGSCIAFFLSALLVIYYDNNRTCISKYSSSSNFLFFLPHMEFEVWSGIVKINNPAYIQLTQPPMIKALLHYSYC